MPERRISGKGRRAARLCFLLAAIALAAMIFRFSAQTGEESARTSGLLAERVASVVSPGFSQLTELEKQGRLEAIGRFVRKAGHFCEFALLAAALAGFFRLSPNRSASLRAVPIAWLLSTLYAATDEAHQIFVEGRGPSPWDVGLDSLGALTGAIFLAGAAALLRRRKRT